MAIATSMSLNLIGSFKGLSLSSTSSFLRGDLHFPTKTSFTVTLPLENLQAPVPLTIKSAHKKGAGSTKNGRDSPGQRLGVKIYGDQVAKPGAIIVRQRGTKFHAGKNVGIGKDHTIFSLIDGLVKFEKFGPDRKKISVYPREIVPENPNSYRARKRESFRLQREKKKARRENYTYTIPSPQLVLASAAIDDAETNPDC
ncbi:unnamed protein product [Microthlaspi erraticum]|uniref:Large ribosomal subunit protein bL27c n=1 Tax=Microthlaspi erraticum TaxID=1685480 RepID=A0A6D2KPE4_9BRAS|nr:unnamed protein product [Microthlaspi erraticum]CAA7055171.1 unnamed protein product [Microthlaspi erraticum]